MEGQSNETGNAKRCSKQSSKKNVTQEKEEAQINGKRKLHQWLMK